MVPFLNRLDEVVRCLNAMQPQLNADTIFLLIDDGSNPVAHASLLLQPLLRMPNVRLITHPANSGVSAARNSGLHWCRQKGIEIAIMIDSDCTPESNLISEHLRLHHAYPEAICIGARVVGVGAGLWAKLDGITSWIHATEHGVGKDREGYELCPVEHPYHLATTNFSVKLKQLPSREFVFEERLRTGEDCLLIRELRTRSEINSTYFSATPVVFHQDRETFFEVFRHHYEWGHHQYFIQLGGDMSPRCFNAFYRGLFCCVFLPMLPLFALVGALLNSRALIANRSRQLFFFPLIYLLWLGKGVAVLEAALRPCACLRSGRKTIEYVEFV